MWKQGEGQFISNHSDKQEAGSSSNNIEKDWKKTTALPVTKYRSNNAKAKGPEDRHSIVPKNNDPSQISDH